MWSLEWVGGWGEGGEEARRGSKKERERKKERGEKVEVEVERFERKFSTREDEAKAAKVNRFHLVRRRLCFFLPLNAISSCSRRFNTSSHLGPAGKGEGVEAQTTSGGDSLEAAKEKKKPRASSRFFSSSSQKAFLEINSLSFSLPHTSPFTKKLTSCTCARAERACAGSSRLWSWGFRLWGGRKEGEKEEEGKRCEEDEEKQNAARQLI